MSVMWIQKPWSHPPRFIPELPPFSLPGIPEWARPPVIYSGTPCMPAARALGQIAVGGQFHD